MPDFLVGSPKWDNWLVKDAEKRGLNVISATEAITCIHQRHEHRWPVEGAKYNHELWWHSGAGVGYVYSGSWILSASGKLRKKPKGVMRSEPAWATGTVTTKTAPKPRFEHKPVPMPRTSRPAHATPKDEIGLPMNLNISTQELANAARGLLQQPMRRSTTHKHSHGPSREAVEAEMARLQQIQDTIQAARITARDARLAERKKGQAG